MDTMDPRLSVGGNNPPPDTPREKAEAEIGRLYEEARLFLDGTKVDNQSLADDIANLLNGLRTARKRADDARKVDKQPHLDAERAIDAAYKPILERADRAADACKAALAPWLEKLEAQKRAEADAKRQEAEAKRLAAQAAIRATDSANLVERAKAEGLVAEARKAEKAAGRSERDTARAGMVGRSVSLRTSYRPEITDARAFARYVWTYCQDDMMTFLETMARRQVDAGKCDLPGVVVHTEKKAV